MDKVASLHESYKTRSHSIYRMSAGAHYTKHTFALHHVIVCEQLLYQCPQYWYKTLLSMTLVWDKRNAWV